MSRTPAILMSAVLAFATALCAQNRDSKAPIVSVLTNGKPIALVPWSVGDTDLLCVFTRQSQTRQGESAQLTELAVYRQKGPALVKVFQTQTGDSFLEAHLLSENGRVLVTWVTGSAYHFEVFAYLNGAVHSVLDTGSRSIPEEIFDDQGHEYLLFNDMDLVGGEWLSSAGKTRVFHWSGSKYEKSCEVPWVRRLECIASKDRRD